MAKRINKCPSWDAQWGCAISPMKKCSSCAHADWYTDMNATKQKTGKNERNTLRARTKEQKDCVNKFINSSPDICTLNLQFPDNDGIIVYGYVTFDQMAAIVDYLRKQNNK